MCLCAKLLQWCPTLWEWTVAHHALLSMGFSRQEYWSGLQCPPSGDLFDPGIKPALNLHLLCPLHWQVGSLPLTTSGKPNYSLLNTISVLHTFFFATSCGMWILIPGPEIEPKPSALEGRVLTTGPPGMSDTVFFDTLISFIFCSPQSLWGGC